MQVCDRSLTNLCLFDVSLYLLITNLYLSDVDSYLFDVNLCFQDTKMIGSH